MTGTITKQSERQLILTRSLRGMIALFGFLCAPQAQAGGWESFGKAFPMFPCQDGWMACIVTDAHIDPDLQPDTSGRLLSADNRIGWFDLEATSTFSPFSSLSAYPAPPPQPVVVSAPTSPPSRAPNTPKGAKIPSPVPSGEGEDSPPAPIGKPSTGLPGPSGERGGTGEVIDRPPIMPPPPPIATDKDCSNTVALEPTALLGKLTEGVMSCLETRLANSPKPTDKKKISALLMADAWAKGDKTRWEVLIKRHLDEIDQSDPDLCYKYAVHLSRQGASRAEGVIRWSNTALENRASWVGETYTSRVYSLYKVRAAAGQSLWQQAEESYTQSPSDDARERVDKYRALTKVSAREWYDYAKSSGKDSGTALQLCMSAAGTSDYCAAE